MDHPAHRLKCSLKMSAVAALVVCVLTSHVLCRPQDKSIFSVIQKEIRISLKDLNDTGLLSTHSCSSLNETELAGLDEQPFSAQNLSLFRCHMMKASAVTTELALQLQKISQFCESAAAVTPGYVSHNNCSLPPFEHVKDSYDFVQCLLKLLNQVLSKAQRSI